MRGFEVLLSWKPAARARALAVSCLLAAACAVPALAASSGASGKTSASVAAPEKLVSFEPEFSEQSFMLNLQSVLEESGLEAGIALFSEIPEEYADSFDLLFLKAALLMSAEHYADAKTICTALLSRDPTSVDALSLSATIAKATGDTRERDKQLKALLAIDDYNTEANIGLGDDAFARKNYKPARQYYQKALVREPTNLEALLGVGRASYYLEDDDRADATFHKILELNPSYAPAYSYLGKLSAARNEYASALGYARQALALDASNYDYVMDYGMYERYLGHYDGAEEAWTSAIALQPSYFLAYAYRAGLRDERGQYAAALEDYKRVVTLNPDYYYAYESMGVLALHEEDWKSARMAFMKCYEMNKDNISYPLMVTYCYYKEKDSLNAKKFSDSVLRKLDRSSIEYAMLRVYHDLAGAMPLPQRIASITSTNKRGKMYFYLGLLYDLMGGAEASQSWFMEVIKMNSPMFFEYRLAEWSVGLDGTAN